jgi:predicted ATPase
MRALHVGSLPDPLSSALPPAIRALEEFCIYNLNALALRGIHNVSRRTPLGLNGENLDVVLSYFTPRQLAELERYSKIIPWFDKLILDPEDELKFKGHKLGRSTSRLYFQDRFMRRGNNVFSAESANEGILHILFYLALFLGDKTPFVFGIDNIETALNPQLCRDLMKSLAALAKTHGKQALITTHNPAILDGLNLHDDGQRLFVVYRNDAGHTTTKRIKLKPETGEPRLKLSELWMRGHLGGIPKAF